VIDTSSTEHTHPDQRGKSRGMTRFKQQKVGMLAAIGHICSSRCCKAQNTLELLKCALKTKFGSSMRFRLWQLLLVAVQSLNESWALPQVGLPKYLLCACSNA